jgi:SET domain-containing protein
LPRQRPRFEVRGSRIHGRGLFALQRFRRDEYIGTFRGTRTRRNGRYVLWLIADDDRFHGIRGENELRFINHADRPNADFYGVDLYATRSIRPGDEITIDYGAWEEG